MNLSELRARINRSTKIFTDFRIPDSPEEKKELLYFLVLFLLFSVAAITSVVNFGWLNISGDTVNETQFPPIGNGGEINAKINAFNTKYDLFMKRRNDSKQLVELAQTVGKYPVALLPANVQTAEKLEVPDFAPQIGIKALVVMGSGGVATLDIENETPGLIVRPGTVFGGGKGKIIAIDSKGVGWTWSNKKYRTNL